MNSKNTNQTEFDKVSSLLEQLREVASASKSITVMAGVTHRSDDGLHPFSIAVGGDGVQLIKMHQALTQEFTRMAFRASQSYEIVDAIQESCSTGIAGGIIKAGEDLQKEAQQ